MPPPARCILPLLRCLSLNAAPLLPRPQLSMPWILRFLYTPEF